MADGAPAPTLRAAPAAGGGVLRVLAAALTAAPISFVAAGVGLLSLTTLAWLSTWGTSAVYLTAATLLWARVIVIAEDRGAWAAFAGAACCWAGANLYYALVYSPGAPPVVSWSDAGYLAFPWFFSLGLLRYARVRLPRVPVEGWMDAVIVALAAAAFAAGLIFTSVHVRASSFDAVTTTVLYPAQDIVIVGLLLGVGTALGWRLTIPGRLLVISILCVAIGDVLTLTRVLEGSTYGGAWPNAGWTTGLVALVGAAWWPARPLARERRGASGHTVVLPAVAGMLALAIVALADELGLGAVAESLATAAIVVVLARLLFTVHEVRVLADTRRLALTDDLTGLDNRRRLLGDLAQACAGGEAHVLTLFDLDGFKSFNDLHGHLAGDDLLSALASRLRSAVPAGGRAYRLGGDEFCTLVPAGPAAEEAVGASVDALEAQGEDWVVTASWGAVTVGVEAGDPSDALRVADERMYERKRRRPEAARAQVRDALLRALGEQQPVLHAHTRDVTGLVDAVARRLGMSEQDIDDTIRAAELHDIGKLAIPAAILDKPGPLDDAEMAVMRTHTVLGERMLRAAPALLSVAPLVRASHERFDGGGYPDGLAGEAIPLGARVVTVCDSFDAMVAERPYRPARSRAEAIAELQRCAGTQFDPAVVAAFVACLD